MLVLVVGVVVDAHDDRDVGVGRRSGDEHLLRACVEMLLRAFAVREEARRLDDDVDAEVLPRQALSGRALPSTLNEVPSTLISSPSTSTPAKAAVRRVVAQEVRQDVRRREIVHGDDVEVALPRQVRADEVPPDPPEAVDAYLECHAPPVSVRGPL